MFKKIWREFYAIIINRIQILLKNMRLWGISPVHIVIVICLILMISIRLLSDYDKNRIIMNEIADSSSIETSTTITAEVTSENSIQNITENSTESTTQSPTNNTIETKNDVEGINNDNQVVYSAELGKTYTISEFSNLTKEEYMTFPGIGEVTAQRILDYIAESGPFESFDEIMEVKGIGEKKLEKLMNILP